MNADNTSGQHRKPGGHEGANGQAESNIVESILKHPTHGINFRTAAMWFTKYEIMAVNLLAALVGVISGYAAVGFRYLIGFFQNMFMSGSLSFELANPMNHSRGYWVVIIPPIGLFIVWLLVRFFAKEAKGHGIPEVMEAVIVHKGVIRKRIVAIKALASSICIAAGGSVGREGPIVQIGSAAGSGIGQIFKLRSSLIKVLVGCGAAGGIAATFNTPIAGIIFAIELILLELKTSSFIPLVISTVFATLVSRIYLGSQPAFMVPQYALAHPVELVFYLGLGLLAALAGVLTVYVLYWCEDRFEELKIPAFSKPLLGGLFLGAMGLFYPQIFGVGYETISDVLQQHTTLSIILPLIFIKIAAMSVTLGAGGSGGIFAPSLFIGAMLGGAYGILMNNLFPDITAGYGAYALVGMAAVFAATSRATLSAITILFEMTMDYQIILPLMFACVVSDQLSWLLSKETIYTKKLRRRGLTFCHDLGIDIMAVKSVGEVMSRKIVTAVDAMSVKEAGDRLLSTGHHIFPVIDQDNTVTGVLLALDLKEAANAPDSNLRVESLKKSPGILTYPNEIIMTALKKMNKTGLARLIVVERSTRKLLGIVSGKDFLKVKYSEDE